MIVMMMMVPFGPINSTICLDDEANASAANDDDDDADDDDVNGILVSS